MGVHDSLIGLHGVGDGLDVMTDLHLIETVGDGGTDTGLEGGR